MTAVRQVAAAGAFVDDVPAPFLVGRCVEVWADEGAAFPQRAAVKNYHSTKSALVERLKAAGQRATFPRIAAAPWSIEFCLAHGDARAVVDRLAVAGFALEDVPELRRGAVALMVLLGVAGYG